MAEGKLRVACATGARVAPGLIHGAAGMASQDSHDYYADGALTACGPHKGSGLSQMIELLARGLCGVNPTEPGNHGFDGTLAGGSLRRWRESQGPELAGQPSRKARLGDSIECRVVQGTFRRSNVFRDYIDISFGLIRE